MLAALIENRREEREEANESALVQLWNPVAPEGLPVKILNTSKRGLCISIAVFLSRGAEVRVFVGEVQFFGRIRYCIASPRGFRAGIELDGRIEPSSNREFQPSTAD
jgi:hypothetical protein